MSSNKEAGAPGKTLGEELATAASSEGGDGGGKKRRKGRRLKKKLLAIPIIGVLVAVLVGFAWKHFGGATEKAGREMFLRKAHSMEEGSNKDGENAALLKAPDPHIAEEEPEAFSMTMSESIDYIETLAPRSLGLEGNSMDEYEVLPKIGTVLVDGVPCTEVFVYRQDDRTGTNVFQGTYLLDRSGMALYALDQEEGAVTPLQPAQNG